MRRPRVPGEEKAVRVHAWIAGAASAAGAIVTLVAAGRVQPYSDLASQVLDGFAMVLVIFAFVLVVARPRPAAVARTGVRRMWTAESDRELLAMYADDRSLESIAAALGVDGASVSKRLIALLFRDDAVPLPEPVADPDGAIGPAEGAYLLRAHRDGVPIAGIARTVGRTDLEVARYIFTND